MTARAAKAEATRTRIRVSAMELYCQRPVEDFTLEEIAARAGVAVRTILRAYRQQRKAALCGARRYGRGRHVSQADTAGRRESGRRRPSLISTRRVGDLVMQRLDDEHRHPGLKPTLDPGRDNHRDGVKTVFAPQLERQHGAARVELLNILVVADRHLCLESFSAATWGWAGRAAEAIVRKMISGVLEGETADGENSVAQLVGRRQPAA